MTVSALLWALIAGAVVGLLAKLVAPGDHSDVPLWLTVLCGVGGVLLGNYLYTRFFNPSTPGVDWWRHVWQITVAAALVTLAASSTGRKRV